MVSTAIWAGWPAWPPVMAPPAAVADEAGASGGVRGWPGARVALPGVGGSARAGAWLVEAAPELVERVAAAGCSGKVSDPLQWRGAFLGPVPSVGGRAARRGQGRQGARGGPGPGCREGVRREGGHGIQHAGMEQGDAARPHAFPGEGGQCRMQPGELFEPLVQHVPQGAHLALGQTGQRHQFGGDGEGIDAACLPRIEVGADAAAIIVGVLLEQLVHLFPLDGNEAGLTAAGEIADGLIGVTGDHEGGIQGAVTEPSSRLPGGDHRRRLKSATRHPMASSRAGW